MLDIDHELTKRESEVNTFSPAELRKALSTKDLSLPEGTRKAATAGPALLQRRASTITTAMLLGAVDSEIAKRVKPVVVCGIMEFEKEVDEARVRRIAHDHIFSLPRMRCRPATAEDGTIMLEEVQEASLDLGHHVQVVQHAAPWSNQDLDGFISTVYDRGLGYERPPWVVFIINDVKGAHMVLIMIDHALTDGTSAIAVLMSLLDEEEEEEEEEGEVRKGGVPGLPPRKRPRPTISPFHRVRAIANGVKTGLLGALLPQDPPNRLKIKDHRKPGPKKSLATSEKLDLAKVKELTAKFDHCTVTDILLSVMTITLRRYYESHGEVPDSVRGNFPIDLRAREENVIQSSLGNRFANASFEFNLKYASTEQVVYATKQQADFLKNSPGPLIETWLLGKVVPLLSKTTKLRQVLSNLVLDVYGKVTGMLSSNMGPQHEVSFAGQPVKDLRFYAFAPIALYFGIISYDGSVSAGVVLDANLGEASELAQHWRPAFDTLYAAAMKYDGAVPYRGSSVPVVHWPSLLCGGGVAVAVLGYYVLSMLLLLLAFFVWA